MPYLDVQHLSYSLPQGVPLMRDLSFCMEQGEMVCLLGPSGCGKTSLLRCLAGLNTCTGSVMLDRQERMQLPPHKRQIGMVFQHHALFPHLTVAENITFGLRVQKIPAKEHAGRVQDVLALMELSGMEQRKPAQLSGGEQQRVSLARSLVLRPKLLLLDEPLAALDAPIRRSLRTHIRNIQQSLGISTLFVTHDQEEALSISDRVFLMHKGALVQTGSPEELYTRPNSLFSARFMGAYSVFSPQEAQQLLGKNINRNLAIRPESIHFSPPAVQVQDYCALQARVRDVHILGTLVRYTMVSNAVSFTVDALNRKPQSLLTRGSLHTVYLDLHECIELA